MLGTDVSGLSAASLSVNTERFEADQSVSNRRIAKHRLKQQRIDLADDSRVAQARLDAAGSSHARRRFNFSA
ncbi:MAG: hypothetical protein HY606_15380 [Planctomycetes bacterium]|nr:hypothetical protein [Planctomycetota bacterium]